MLQQKMMLWVDLKLNERLMLGKIRQSLQNLNYKSVIKSPTEINLSYDSVNVLYLLGYIY